MTLKRSPHCAAAALAVAGWIALAPAAVAAPAPSRAAVAAAAASEVVHVHRRYGRYGRHYHRRRHIVDAPFAYVETGRRTIVEAPFTSVYVGRYGRHIRAPFVDLWIPR